MDNPLIISLVVTGIGMLMLFLALTLLYGLMYLMMAFIKDRAVAGAEERRSKEAGEWAAMRRRAAVIAVALARAEQELSASPPEAEAGLSPWRQYHHHRLLSLTLRKRMTL